MHSSFAEKLSWFTSKSQKIQQFSKMFPIYSTSHTSALPTSGGPIVDVMVGIGTYVAI